VIYNAVCWPCGDALAGCSNVQLGEHTLILAGVYESPEEHDKGICLFTCNAFEVYSELLLSIGKVGHGRCFIYRLY